MKNHNQPNCIISSDFYISVTGPMSFIHIPGPMGCGTASSYICVPTHSDMVS
jgi:hypothetical protein